MKEKKPTQEPGAEKPPAENPPPPENPKPPANSPEPAVEKPEKPPAEKTPPPAEKADTPAKPAEKPPFADRVINGKKSEGELRLAKTLAAREAELKNREQRIAQLEDENQQLKTPPAPAEVQKRGWLSGLLDEIV